MNRLVRAALRRRRLVFLFFLLCLPAISPDAAAQIFPDTVYAWRKTGETLVPQEDWKASLGERTDTWNAYGVSEFRVVTYAQQGKSLRIEVAQLPSRERAFGLFHAMADGISAAGNSAYVSAPQGIIGDAFAYERSAAHVNFGPFYFRVATADTRTAVPPDEALVVRTRRVLFAHADCYGSDFPLPTDERVLGSERYLPPDAVAWRAMHTHLPEGLLPVLNSHAAYVAEFEKRHAGGRRTVMLFPFRQATAAAAFAAELVQQLEAYMGARRQTCALPSFVRAGVQRVVAADPTRVMLIVTTSDDSGCCEWARGLLRR